MLVGVLSGDDLANYYNLTRLAPIQFIVPPLVWLSAPGENIDRQVINHLNDEGSTTKVQLQPTAFRHLYNPDSGIPGFCAAMLPMQNSVSELRRKLGILEYEQPFIPTMLICHDGMRTQNVKQFCRGLSDVLVNKPMVFEVFFAEESNPEHATAFKNYNPATHEVFAHAVNYQ